MQLTCPCCFARYAIEAALTDDDARRAVAAALKLPAPLGDLLLRYIGLFRPTKRALSWGHAAKLLTELLGPIQAGRVERNGRTWAAPTEAWKAAIEQMLAQRDRLTLPIKTHGYLFEIIAGQANKIEAQAEAKTEAQKHQRPHRDTGETLPIGEVLDMVKQARPVGAQSGVADVPKRPFLSARDPAKINAQLSKLKNVVKP